MDKTVLPKSLQVLNKIGLHPNSVSKPRASIHLLIIVASIIPPTLEMILHWEGMGEFGSEGEVITSLIQGFAKSATLLVYREELSIVINIINKKFWKPHDFEGVLTNEVLRIHSLLWKLFSSYQYILTVAVAAHALKPLIVWQRIYPNKWYSLCDIQSIECYTFNYLWQAVNLWNLFFIVLGFDGMFFSVISHMYCELLMIKHGFCNVDIDEAVDGDEKVTLEKFADVVKHHVMALECTAVLQKIFSPVLFWQFLVSFITVCTEMLVMLSEGYPPSLLRIGDSGSKMTSLYFQTFIYCLAGQYISEQTESVCYALYESGWWKKNQPILRKEILIVMQRVRIRSSLTIYNVVNVDIGTFAEIIKKSVTFFTFVKTMYEVENRVQV